jgi:hypothetical protein
MGGEEGKKQTRDFLTDEEFNVWGDVDIWARGMLPTGKEWITKSRLYDALIGYYKNQPTSTDVQKALKQIREN